MGIFEHPVYIRNGREKFYPVPGLEHGPLASRASAFINVVRALALNVRGPGSNPGPG